MTELIALLAAITAFFAVVLGPLVSMWVSKQQTRVSVLSNNRQAWINELRDTLSEIMAIHAFLQAADWSERTEHEFDEKHERLFFLNSKIELLLNTNETDHKRLIEILKNSRSTLGGRVANRDKRDPEKWRSLIAELIPLSQSILKREWERVKRVE